MTKLEIYVLLFGVLLNYILSGTEAVYVKIEQGVLRGTTLKSRNGREFPAFMGIPYVKPPVGKLRWMPPQEPNKWGCKVYNATSLPEQCVQVDVFNRLGSPARGSEDCLYLNVFTARVGKRARLPVLVIIPGGAFTYDSTVSYMPTYFLDYDITMVTFNYRLGVMGFLNTVNKVAPGNFGMKDQVAALKWVQKNIAAFGGDPNSVTIMGMSAGGTSVDYHLYSPLSSGLFQKAICMSGSALAHYNYDEPKACADRAKTLGILTGCRTNSTQEMVDCLREVPAAELVVVYNKFLVFEESPMPFTIAIEPSSIGKDRFLPDNPFNMEIVNKVPYLAGMSAGEGAFKVTAYLSNNATFAKLLNKQIIRLLAVIFTYGKWLPKNESEEISRILKDFYFGDKDISLETKSELVDIFSDAYFYYSGLMGAKRYAKIAPTYFYYMDHMNENSICSKLGDYKGNLGGCHGDILFSFYPDVYGFKPISKPKDVAVSKRMLQYWYNFIRYGNPNGKCKQLWKPITSDEFEYLSITTDKDEMRTKLLEERYLFWKNLDIDPAFTVQDTDEVEEQLCRCGNYGCY